MFLQSIFAVVLVHQLGSLYVSGEICPHPEDISPCQCRYEEGAPSNIHVECVGGNVSAVANAFSEFEGKTIQTVVLRNVRNGRLPSLLFWNVKVQELKVVNCQLEGIADTDRRPAFVGLENSLETLTIDNSITGANKLVSVNLAHLSRLKKLTFEKINIPEVSNEWFEKGPTSLKDLLFESCTLRKLGDRAFDQLNLSYLRIFNCSIKSFRRSMLPRPAKNLYTFSLRNNNLASPPTDLFDEMPYLKHLYLPNNFIRRLQSAPFSSVWEKLETLYLGGNPLECDAHMNWLLSLKRPKDLDGKCASPEGQKNKTLAEFIDSNKKASFQEFVSL